MAKINNEQEALLTIQEAAEFLRMSRSTIYRMVKRGDLKAHKVGKKWLIYMKDLKELVERGAKPTEEREAES